MSLATKVKMAATARAWWRKSLPEILSSVESEINKVTGDNPNQERVNDVN